MQCLRSPITTNNVQRDYSMFGANKIPFGKVGRIERTDISLFEKTWHLNSKHE